MDLHDCDLTEFWGSCGVGGAVWMVFEVLVSGEVDIGDVATGVAHDEIYIRES